MNSGENDEPARKRAKLSDPAEEETPADSSTTQNDAPLLPFREFAMDKVLFTDPTHKSIAVSGTFGGSSEVAVIVAEKQPLEGSNIMQLFAPEVKEVTRNLHNDIYSQYVVESGGELGTCKLTTVYPATDKHVQKYSRQTYHLVHESPDLYRKITRPYIEQQGFSLKWVYNILDGVSESDRVVCNDEDPEIGLILLPDLKWDRKCMDNLYVLALARRRGILSLRELTNEHLPLLKNILIKGKSSIGAKYGVPEDELRAYLHYQPSYYHLHVHFTHLSYSAPKSTVGDAHLLDDVIDNIENIDAQYYSKKTLSFTLNESHDLWKLFEQV